MTRNEIISEFLLQQTDPNGFLVTVLLLPLCLTYPTVEEETHYKIRGKKHAFSQEVRKVHLMTYPK